MKKTTKILTLLSMCINFAVLLMGAYFIYQKGGIQYIKTKTNAVLSNNSSSYDNYYLDKKNIYEVLPSDSKSIIFLGDSLTDKCEWNELFNNNNIKNRGINGDTTKGVLNRINDVTKKKPSKIFIMIGTNDIGRGVSINEIIDNYNEILNKIHSKDPNTKVYVQSILPVLESMDRTRKNLTIKKINNQLKVLTNKYNYTYIDLYSSFVSEKELDSKYTIDGLHINGQGYLIWKQAIEKYVN